MADRHSFRHRNRGAYRPVFPVLYAVAKLGHRAQMLYTEYFTAGWRGLQKKQTVIFPSWEQKIFFAVFFLLSLISTPLSAYICTSPNTTNSQDRLTI